MEHLGHAAGLAGATTHEAPAPALGTLLKDFGAGTPAPQGKVSLDAWIDAGADGPEVVVQIQPEGKTKLIAEGVR